MPLLRRHALAIGLVLLGLVLAGATAARTSPTADEAKHVLNGLAFLETGEGLHDETPSAVLHALLMDREGLILEPWERYRVTDGVRQVRSDDFWLANEARAGSLLWRARLPTVLCFGLLLLVLYRWARELHADRPWVALVVLGLAATCPTLLGHAAVATSDLFLTLCATGAGAALWRAQGAPELRRAAWLAGWLGLALVAKISGIFVYATFVPAFAWLWWRAGSRRRLLSLAMVIVLPLLLLHASYGLAGALRPLRGQPLASATLRQVAASPLGVMPLPVPAGYARAIDFSLADKAWRTEVDHLPSFMLGERFFAPRWSYFPFAFLVKTSGVILVLLALGLARARRHGPRGSLLALGLFPAVFLLVNVVANSFDIGVRYLLPIYPFVILACGIGLPRQLAVPAVAVQLFWTVMAFPGLVSSFNAIAWLVPPERLLSDSNLDWGQRDDLVPADLAAHPLAAGQPLHVCTVGPPLGLPASARGSCWGVPTPGRLYLGRTVAMRNPRLTSALPPPVRVLGGVIEVYELARESDFKVRFCNGWLADGAPLPASFGQLAVPLPEGGGCTVLRSEEPLAGRLWLFSDGDLEVHAGAVAARQARPPGKRFHDLVVDLPAPTPVEVTVCGSRARASLAASLAE